MRTLLLFLAIFTIAVAEAAVETEHLRQSVAGGTTEQSSHYTVRIVPKDPSGWFHKGFELNPQAPWKIGVWGSKKNVTQKISTDEAVFDIVWPRGNWQHEVPYQITAYLCKSDHTECYVEELSGSFLIFSTPTEQP